MMTSDRKDWTSIDSQRDKIKKKTSNRKITPTQSFPMPNRNSSRLRKNNPNTPFYLTKYWFVWLQINPRPSQTLPVRSDPRKSHKKDVQRGDADQKSIIPKAIAGAACVPAEDEIRSAARVVTSPRSTRAGALSPALETSGFYWIIAAMNRCNSIELRRSNFVGIAEKVHGECFCWLFRTKYVFY